MSTRWSQCPLVDVNPRVQSGVPVLRGTRVPVQAIVDNFDYGLSVAEISEQFEVKEGGFRRFWFTARVIALSIVRNNGSAARARPT
jgi:uncharacterized protein (DUF433 family)